MPYDFNIYHSQVTPSIPDYDTITVTLTGDLENYATKSYVSNFGDNKYLSLLGGSLSGDLVLVNEGSTPKNLILKSGTGIPISIRAGITFVSALTSETGIIVPGLLITDGRLDITPDPIFNRAEFRIKGNQTQFNIFNINTFDFYMRVNSDTSVMFGKNTVALSAGAISFGTNTSAVNTNAFATGANNIASGENSFVLGANSIADGFRSYAIGTVVRASGSDSMAVGRLATAVNFGSWIWRGTSFPFGSTPLLSTTRDSQFAVHADGGITLNNRVGIGTDSIANALTVVGEISATSTVFSSGAPVVVSSSRFETPTTSISSISNIVALSQATYNALTVKRPNTLYVIV